MSDRMEVKVPDVNAGGIYDKMSSREGGNDERGKNGIGAREATSIIADGRFGGVRDMEPRFGGKKVSNRKFSSSR
jgi:hypothetical protein